MAKKTTTKKSNVKKTSKAAAAKKRTTSTTKQAKKTASTKAKPVKQTISKVKATKKSTPEKRAGLGARFSGGKKLVQGLRGLHILNVAALSALITMVYLVMGPVVRTVVSGFAANDALRGEGVLAPAVRDVVSFDVRHALTALLAVGIIYSLYVATKGWKRYQEKIASNRYSGHWVFAAVSGAIALETAAVVNGVYDLTTIKLLGLLVVLAAVLAFMAQRLVGVREKLAAMMVATIVAAAAILALAYFIALSVIYGATLSWHAYVAAGVIALAVFTYGAVQYMQIKGQKGYLTPQAVEQKYVLTSMIATIVFTAVLVVGYVA